MIVQLGKRDSRGVEPCSLHLPLRQAQRRLDPGLGHEVGPFDVLKVTLIQQFLCARPLLVAILGKQRGVATHEAMRECSYGFKEAGVIWIGQHLLTLAVESLLKHSRGFCQVVGRGQFLDTDKRFSRPDCLICEDAASWQVLGRLCPARYHRLHLYANLRLSWSDNLRTCDGCGQANAREQSRWAD